MSKNTKKVFWGFLLFDYKAVNEYLEKMAEKGWMLQKVGRYTAQFKAIEPQSIKFYVDVFPGSVLSADNNQELINYRDLCEESGWIFVDDYYQLQIFFAPSDTSTPIPIQTDKVIEQKIAESKIVKNELLPFTLLLLFYLLIFASDSLNPFQIEYTELLTFIGVTNTVLLPYIIFFNLIIILLMSIWVFRTRKAVKRGIPLPKPNIKIAKIRGTWFYFSFLFIFLIYFISIIGDVISTPITGIIMLFIPLIGVFGGLFLRKYVKNNGLNNKKSIIFVAVSTILIVTIGVVIMIFGIINASVFITKERELPQGYEVMKLDDFYDGNNVVLHRNFDNGNSPLVPTHYDYYEISKKGSIRTEHYQAINSYFAKIIFDGIIEEHDEKLIITNPTDWNADDVVFLDNTGTILILKSNKVVLIDGDFDFSDSNTRNIVLSKLF
ncbi:DUF2812 domain-containing protein [Chengkuizengella marina]|uniref:DUF2812 domain-containing protein n=1 Tax=Chengkuizengella marina TaxID=2507566 RepID=A0A6N9Q6S7_9BACL|nr:DUF2812 domain-containing protein [Chengkuizengella marina]NBI30519.1 DUF2812 domain-containing protein [Chengkuizengella marina]